MGFKDERQEKIFVSRIAGDFIFNEWEDEDWRAFSRKIHELRKKGYRKIGVYRDYLNYYETYRIKGKKRKIVVTMCCC